MCRKMFFLRLLSKVLARIIFTLMKLFEKNYTHPLFQINLIYYPLVNRNLYIKIDTNFDSRMYLIKNANKKHIKTIIENILNENDTDKLKEILSNEFDLIFRAN